MRLIDTLLDHRAANGSGGDLIAALCGARGLVVAIPTNLGQQKLADWLCSAPWSRVVRYRVLPEKVRDMLLTGELEPSDGVALWLADLTEGAVRAEMFHQTPAPASPPSAGADGPADPTTPGDRPATPSDVKAIRTRAGVYISGENWAQRIPLAHAQALHSQLTHALGGGVR